ncbi:MAG TPA: Trm112 family protein [Thermomicrobiales bacterium]|nr:Trm112 family protein [Thermomicrobiales bacterium]
MSEQQPAAGAARAGGQPAEEPVISPELLEILACPIDRSPVKLVGDRLVCEEQGHKYRIEDGIPIMLVDEVEQ